MGSDDSGMETVLDEDDDPEHKHGMCSFLYMYMYMKAHTKSTSHDSILLTYTIIGLTYIIMVSQRATYMYIVIGTTPRWQENKTWDAITHIHTHTYTVHV